MAAIMVFIAIELLKWALVRVMPLPLDGTPFTADHSVPSLIANIFLFNAFGLFDGLTWNEPSWSIGTEFYTYMVFVIAVLTFGASRWVFAALSLSGAIIIALFSPSYMYATYDFGFFRCLYGFFAGCLVYGLHSRRTAVLPAMTPIEFGAVILTALYLLIIRPNPLSLLTPLVFGAIVYIFAEEGGAVSRLLRRPWPQRLGLYSYSIYMTHYFVLTCCKIAFTLASKWVPGVHFRQFPNSHGPNDWTFGDVRIDSILTVVYVGLVLVLSHFTYRWIEDPCRKWFAARAERMRGPSVVRPGFQGEGPALPGS
jgi:peptidoglycan/LPS O-acetylase OafA/YrhL